MRWFAFTTLLLLNACEPPQEAWVWALPKRFPTPRVPAENPMTQAKVELGRALFSEVRLSANRTQSCQSCHDPARAFTDGLVTSIGSTGSVHPRNAQPLINVAYNSTLTWANPLLTTLESQARIPILNEHPVELGWADATPLVARLRSEGDYATAFREAFSSEAEPISLTTITFALASFERTLIFGNSPYDRWSQGDPSAVSDSVKRGFKLFNSEQLECYHCHTGFNFTDSTTHADAAPNAEAPFHNNGLYNLDGQGALPAGNQGLIEVTERAQDMGKFRTPTLRNLKKTAPYMHDGSRATLADVLRHYAAGGTASPLQSDLVRGFTLTEQETSDVIAFLDSLSDD